MLSFRTLSRALPRSLPRLATQSQPRFLSTIHRTSLLHQTCKAASIPRYAAFSTSRSAREKEGQVDQELSAKIESELQLEREMRDSEQLPSSLQDYLDSSSFELHDTPGREEVVLTRKFGDESLRVSFSIADLTNMDSDNDPDPALYDEDDEPSIPEASAQSGGANTKGAVNAGHTKGGNINIAPEDRVAPADREGLAEEESAPANDEDEPSFPARINVMIEKVGKGTLQIETTAQDGEIVIENVYYFKDAELADAKTAELDWKRKDLYEGPPFGNLDEDLQVLLERYLDERGINTALAMWVPEYIDFKEQREYLNWLSNVKSFVDA
ncbi:regulatory protein suaprga1 [Usnea florida]